LPGRAAPHPVRPSSLVCGAGPWDMEDIAPPGDADVTDPDRMPWPRIDPRLRPEGRTVGGGATVPHPLRVWVRQRLGVDGSPDDWTPLPGGRTNRLWRVRARPSDLIVKLYLPGRASRLFPNSPAAEARVLGVLAGTGLAPGLLSVGATSAGRVLAYRAVEGRIPHDEGDMAAVARSLAAVHDWPVGSGFRRVSVRPAALAFGLLADLAKVPPGGAVSRLRGVAARAPAQALAPGPSALLHGDPATANMLVVRPGEVTLIDWQCPALGDPVHDLAIALSPGMRVLYGQSPLTAAERAAFWQDYGRDDVRGRFGKLSALLSARLAAHFLAQAARGRPGYAGAAEAEVAALEE